MVSTTNHGFSRQITAVDCRAKQKASKDVFRIDDVQRTALERYGGQFLIEVMAGHLAF